VSDIAGLKPADLAALVTSAESAHANKNAT